MRKSLCSISENQSVPNAVYIDVTALGERHFRVQKVGSSGIVDLEGRCVIPLQPGCLYCEEKVCITSKAGKKDLSRPEGVVLLLAGYDQIWDSEDRQGRKVRDH